MAQRHRKSGTLPATERARPAWWAYHPYDSVRVLAKRESIDAPPNVPPPPREHRYVNAHAVKFYFWDVLDALPDEYWSWLMRAELVDVVRTIEQRTTAGDTTFWDHIWTFYVRAGKGTYKFARVCIASTGLGADDHTIEVDDGTDDLVDASDQTALTAMWRRGIRCANKCVIHGYVDGARDKDDD